MGEFRPGNKTVWVVFDEESECLGPKRNLLRLDQVSFRKKRTLEKNMDGFISFFLISSLFYQ